MNDGSHVVFLLLCLSVALASGYNHNILHLLSVKYTFIIPVINLES